MKSHQATFLNDQNSASQKNSLLKIPTLSDKKKDKTLLGLFSPTNENNAVQRLLRHYTAESLAHALYHAGATLINQGLAYQPELKSYAIEDFLKNEVTEHLNGTDAHTEALMEEYNKLPNFTALNGSNSAENPLQALFVIKVALDHLSPKAIYEWYLKLRAQLQRMTITTHVIHFPNESEFLNDHAVYEILASYIAHDLPKFSEVPNELKSPLNKKPDHFFIVGRGENAEEGMKWFDCIMQSNTFVVTPQKEESARLVT